VGDHSSGQRTEPGGFCLPLDKEQIEAAKATYRVNKGAQWSEALAVGLMVGDNPELRNGLMTFLLEFDVPTATISDMFGLSGRELWDIAASDPVSMFFCLDCGALLAVRDRRDLLRLRRALRVAVDARAGDPGDTTLLCEPCTALRLQIHNEEQRLKRLARQARAAQLRKMPFSEYRLTSEWQARRNATLSRAGYRCQACGEHDTRLDCHHNDYTRYGEERIFDLVVLCGQCHTMFHGRMRDAS
jgi:5-methylcytosine-specific restriction endonuclease McrA